MEGHEKTELLLIETTIEADEEINLFLIKTCTIKLLLQKIFTFECEEQYYRPRSLKQDRIACQNLKWIWIV